MGGAASLCPLRLDVAHGAQETHKVALRRVGVHPDGVIGVPGAGRVVAEIALAIFNLNGRAALGLQERAALSPKFQFQPFGAQIALSAQVEFLGAAGATDIGQLGRGNGDLGDVTFKFVGTGGARLFPGVDHRVACHTNVLVAEQWLADKDQ